MPIRSEVYEFFVEGKNPHVSHVLLHIASPRKPEGDMRGYFFVLAEMDQPEGEILGTIEDLIKDGETLYYAEYDGNTQNSDDPETKHFESVVEKLNRKAKVLLEREDERKIHIAVGTIRDNKLSFAYRGNIVALLAYMTAEGPSHTPIIDEPSYPTHVFFSSVVEGNFTPEEAVYLSTPHIVKYFSHDRIAKMIIGKSSKQSARQIQKTLEGISSEYSFGGIVLSATEVAEPIHYERPIYKTEIGSTESIDKLIDTTRSTEDTLSPKIFSQLAKSLTGSFKKNETEDEIPDRESTIRETSRGKYRRKRVKKTDDSYESSGNNSALIIFGKILVWLARALFYVAKTLILGLGKCIAIIACLTTNYNGNRKTLIDEYRASFQKIINAITGLGMFGKILLLALITGIVILSGSIMYTRAQTRKEVIETTYQTQMEDIDEKRKEAESYLLYGENTKALESIRSAESKLTSLTHNTEEKQKRADTLKANLEELLLKVRKITKITPDKIVNIRDFHVEAHTDSITLAGDTIIATGKTDTALYLVSTLTGAVEVKSAETAKELASGYTAKDGLQVAFISEKNQIVSYDTASASIISKTIQYPNQGVILSDIALYNGRLYALDSANGVIYRHNPTQVGYDMGTVWTKTLSDPNTLKNGISFGIDGDLFILTSKGPIIKLTAGEQQPFEIKGLDPVLNSPTIIETNSEFNNLYILEPSQKRVVVTDKEGTFKKQFSADQWENPTGLVISADEKQAYVLDGTTVYKFKL